ncbi:Uncharacterised protein [Chryseobacterium gleum]|uniref:Uncharacterized protein n=2 Tax=Chryseobacterium gleum TaxID=250 RepID=A0A3S4PFZ3_CHRGE|nr:hypothetical protein [Chryseobacterium gleum]EFK37272.1 hypothetical protein HMPREF0204_11118 [Chryseobacterium gleum ATCC 35910]MCD9618905.1 hypothetical protein [Chryseobacterium gleum]MCE4066546.1 hypothetical protein [Chryseobacterium gleum]QBJ87078.1 hypothetical protein DDI74_12740 [Chryseobacterium gleum]QQY33208.1 hypothetical protein I6I60_05365 [Chryseobacterium gleum]
MKNYKIILLLLLTMIGQNVFAQTEVKKPKEAFELFFGTFVNNDETALNKLNEYLKPTVEGQNAYQVDFKETSKEMMNGSVENFLAAFPKATAAACKKEAEDYFTAMLGNFKTGKLTVKNVKVVPNEYLKDEKIAEISYSVSFLVPSKLTPGPKGDLNKIKPEELKKYLIQAAQDFKNADKTVTTEQNFNLYELKEGGKIYYWNGSPDEIVTNLTDFYFESFGANE